jgi:hypothetical protein
MEQFLTAIEENETVVTLRIVNDEEVVIEIRAGSWVYECHIPDPLHFDPSTEIDERLMIACTSLLNTVIDLFELENTAVSWRAFVKSES